MVFEGGHSDAHAHRMPVALLEDLLLQAAVHPGGNDVIHPPFLEVLKVSVA